MGFGSRSTAACVRCILTASSRRGGRDDVLDNVGSLDDLKLSSPNSSVDDVSNIKSCSCSTLRGFVGVCGCVAKAGSSLKWVIVGINRSDDCSSSMPTSVSLDELECCACWCSMKARPCWLCENKISENDDSSDCSDCCCWLIRSSACCCCCRSRKSSDGDEELKELCWEKEINKSHYSKYCEGRSHRLVRNRKFT